MEAKVGVNVAAYPMSINEKCESYLEQGRGLETNITNEKINDMVREAGNFNELYENLRGVGVYLTMENSKVVLRSMFDNDNKTIGTVIFFNDGDKQDKITLDKELSPDVALQIQAAQNRDELEEILIQNNIIERPEKETEREVTVDDRPEYVDRADNVDDRDVTDNGAIGQERYTRYNDPERRSREMAGMDR